MQYQNLNVHCLLRKMHLHNLQEARGEVVKHGLPFTVDMGIMISKPLVQPTTSGLELVWPTSLQKGNFVKGLYALQLFTMLSHITK